MRIRISAKFRIPVPVLLAAVLILPALLHIACNSGGSAPIPTVRAWSPPELIASGVFVGDPPINPAVAISPAGEILVAWESSPFPIKIESARYSPAAGWSSVMQLSETGPSDAVVPGAAVDDGGNMILVWYQDDGTRFNIWSRRYAAGSGWDNALMIENDTGDARRPAIAMNSSGNALAVWGQYDNTYNSIRSNRYVPGSGWGSAEGIETDTGDASDARVGIAANGDAVAVTGREPAGTTRR